MSRRGDLIRARQKLEGRFSERQPLLERWVGLMGDGSGQLYPDATDLTYVFVRRNGRGRVERVRNTRVPARNNLPVIVGFAPERPDEQQVLDLDDAALLTLGAYGYVKHHHQQHELLNPDGGDDTVWVFSQQFLYFLCQVTDPVSVHLKIRSGLYIFRGAYRLFPGATTVDLTVYEPAVAGTAIMLLISVDAGSGALQYTSSVAFVDTIPRDAWYSQVPVVPDGAIPVAAVYVPNGVTEFDWDYVLDWRVFINVAGDVQPHNILSDSHADSAPSTLVRGDLLAVGDGATPLLERFPIGTTHQLVKMNAAGTDPEYDSFDWDEIGSAAGADMVHDHLSGVEGGGLFIAGAYGTYPRVVYVHDTGTLADMDLEEVLFDEDGMLLLGPYSELGQSTWKSRRGITANITGAPHNRDGRWPGTLAPIVEEGATNEIYDPVFGNSVLSDNWTNVGLLTFERGTDFGETGGYALHAVSDNVNDYCHSNTVAGADQNETWIASCRVWVVSGDFKLTIQKNAGGWSDEASIATDELGRWVELQIAVTLPAGTTDGRVKLGPDATASSEFYVDWVQFETDGTIAATASFASTLIWGGAGDGYSWNGVANTSSSTRLATEMELDDSASIFDGKTQWSIAMWIRPEWGTNFHRDAILFDVWEDANNRYTLSYDNSDYFQAAVVIGGASDGITGVVSFDLGDWIHVAWTKNGALHKLFVNGALVDESILVAGGSISPTEMNVGTAHDGSDHAHCAFAEVAVWSVELSESEVLTRYVSGNPLVDAGSMLPFGGRAIGFGGRNQIAYWRSINRLVGDELFVFDGNDVGLGTDNPNISGEARAFTIEDSESAPIIELSLKDDIFGADTLVGIVRWFSGNVEQCAVGQIDLIQSAWYESQSTMRFWVADDCALCLRQETGCNETKLGDVSGGNYTSIENDGSISFGGDAVLKDPGLATARLLQLPGTRGIWPMSSVDYTAANRAVDISGQGNHLTANNVPLFGYDGLAPYVEFDGINQYLSRPDGGAANWADVTGTEAYIAAGQGGLTLGGWFRLNALTGTAQELIGKIAGGGVLRSYNILVQNTTLLQFVVTSGAANSIVNGTAGTTGTMDVGTWWFVAARYIPSTEIKIWLNDRSNINNVGIPASINDSTASFAIGATATPSLYMDGRASMCFLCAAQLSDTIILSLYEQTRSMFGV